MKLSRLRGSSAYCARLAVGELNILTWIVRELVDYISVAEFEIRTAHLHSHMFDLLDGLAEAESSSQDSPEEEGGAVVAMILTREDLRLIIACLVEFMSACEHLLERSHALSMEGLVLLHDQLRQFAKSDATEVHIQFLVDR